MNEDPERKQQVEFCSHTLNIKHQHAKFLRCVKSNLITTNETPYDYIMQLYLMFALFCYFFIIRPSQNKHRPRTMEIENTLK